MPASAIPPLGRTTGAVVRPQCSGKTSLRGRAGVTRSTLRQGRRGPRRGDGEAGFTLVEVLVAFAIASLASVMVLRLASDLTVGSRRIDAAAFRLDEAESLVLVRAAAGSLRAGLEQGRFGDGQPWTLSVVDAAPMLGWHDVPPLWRVRLTLGGPDGRLIYTTLVAGGLGGG